MLNDKAKQTLQQKLFEDKMLNIFAVLDGASIPVLLDQLYDEKPEYCCLYTGELEPDLAQTAPYLVCLGSKSSFTQWVLGEGWGQHWGIFAASNVGLREMRNHFRKFLVVQDPDGKSLYFRYYDPRVLGVYLPTCTAQELEFVFGPISWYLFETLEGNKCSQYFLKNGSLQALDTTMPVESKSGRNQ